MSFLVYLALSAILILTVSGGYVFWAACARRKELPWLVEEEIKKTSYGKYYDYIVAADQWLRDHKTRDLEIISYDGLKLHGIWIPADNAKGTILLAHGYRSTKLVDFGVAFEYYHSLGLNILVPDQRSHGKSQGRYITFGVKESKDMLQWVQYHNSQLGDWQLILSGLSMGASTVMYLADKDLPENVKGIIADCGFTSPKAIISQVFRTVTHLPAAPSVWIADKFAQLFAGFSLAGEDSRKSLAASRVPILIVHGKDDHFVPCWMSEQGYAACTGPKHLLLVDGAGHGVSFIVDTERYTALIMDFLKTNLEGFC